ncbi:MAG: hypothetical protein KF716_11245 [Anaerolineae bacterium]|nr:hypothetical protein [Anaerolineae bacterium]
MFVPNAPTTTASPTDSKPAPPMENVFLFNRGNRRRLDRGTRGVRLSPAETPIWVQAFMLLFVVFMLGVVYQGGFNLLRWLFTNIDGTPIRASVIDRRVSHGKSTSYTVTYAFTVDDQRYVVSQLVDYDIYNKSNELVDVMYWRPNPNFARLSGEYEVGFMFFGSLFQFSCPGTFVILIGAFVVASFRDWRKLVAKQRRLRDEGRLIYGEVITCRGYKKAKQGYKLTIRYGFRTPDPDGRWVNREESRVVNWMQRKPLPIKGTPVAVLYADAQTVEML